LFTKERGCVTPVVLSNLKTLIDDDVDMFDGYEELSQENKDKIALALKEGHVADEDWAWVSDLLNLHIPTIHKHTLCHRLSKFNFEHDVVYLALV
jgi:hypothetical protein